MTKKAKDIILDDTLDPQIELRIEGIDKNDPFLPVPGTTEKKKERYKKSGHLTDQILKYSYPKGPGQQLSLWDMLQESTKNDINASAGAEITEIVEGIKLSPSETKVIDCLCKLLHEHSQNTEPAKEDYYAGDKSDKISTVPYGGDKDSKAPRLVFTLYELTKEYKGGEDISGKDVENVKKILTDLDQKRFLLSYVETTWKGDGRRVERKIEEFQKLILIIKVAEYDKNSNPIDIGYNDTEILLSPIFNRQIDSKFILCPMDLNRRTIIAYGSHNLSEIVLKLREYLMRELSYKRYTPEISLYLLYNHLSGKWMKEGRKKKVKEYTDKALETVKALGLLLKYEIKSGATGEPKVIFYLNQEWE